MKNAAKVWTLLHRHMESRCSSDHFALEAVVFFPSCWSWMVGKNGLWSFRLCGSPAGATCFAQSALIFWGILCILSHRFSAMPFLPASIRNSLESPQSTADEAEMEVVVCHKSLRLVWWQWWQWVLSPKSQLEISIFLSPSWCFSDSSPRNQWVFHLHLQFRLLLEWPGCNRFWKRRT